MTKDVFNTAKYKVYSAISVLTRNGQVANLVSVRKMTGLRTGLANSTLHDMTGRGIIASIDHNKTNGCTLKYRLSAQGKRNLAEYQERHKMGYDLRLKRKKPQKVDWSWFKLFK